MAEQMRFDIVGRDAGAGQVMRDLAKNSDVAATQVRRLADAEQAQRRASDASAAATLASAKADKILRDASDEAIASVVAQRIETEKLARTSKDAAGAEGVGALAGAGGAGGAVPGGAMGALIGAGALLSPVLVTVGFGVAGFGAAAFGAAKPIEKAAQAAGGLQANMGKLNPEQQQVARGLLALGQQYSAFEHQLQPEVLGVFNQGLHLAGNLLHDVEPVAAATGNALGGVIAQISANFQSSEWTNFFHFMSATAGPDVKMLGNLFVDLTNDLPPLLEDLQPVAKGFLDVADAAAKSAGSVTQSFNAVAHGQAFYNQAATDTSHRNGILSDSWHVLLRVLNDTSLNALPTVHKELTGTAAPADQAAAGIHRVTQAAQGAAQATSDMTKTTITTVTPMDHLGKAAGSASFTVSEYGKNANLTVSPADRLGKVADVSAASIGHVATAADFANIKIIQVRHSVQDLTTALSKGLDPLLAYSGALLTQRDDAQNLAQALKASGNRIGMNTDAQRKSFGAANTYIGDLETTAKTAVQSHQGIDKQISSLQNALPALENAQSHSKLYWQEVRTLIGYLDKLRKERAIRESVTVFGAGTWSLSQPGGKLAGPTGTAAGWLVAGGTPGKDSVPIMAMPGELMVPTNIVQAGEVDHLRGRIPGFAAGGIIPKYSGAVAGLPPWISSNQAASVHSITAGIAQSFANSFKSMFEGAAVAPGAGVARWGPLVLQVLGMLGQPRGDLGVVLSQMTTESGGNPFAINLSDSNAAAGDPSRGLMQVIGSTFGAYAGPFLSRGIYDPMANIYAGVNYAIHRYGAAWTSVLGHGHGYAAGGIIREPIFGVGRSGRTYTFGEQGPETVTPGTGHTGHGVVINNHFGPGAISQDTDPVLLAQRMSFQIVAAGLGS